jgi:hypothetical protein
MVLLLLQLLKKREEGTLIAKLDVKTLAITITSSKVTQKANTNVDQRKTVRMKAQP